MFQISDEWMTGISIMHHNMDHHLNNDIVAFRQLTCIFTNIFNNAWAIGPCFTRSPWDPSIVLLHHLGFTLVINEWMVFH
jgi:hypothetical protein